MDACVFFCGFILVQTKKKIYRIELDNNQENIHVGDVRAVSTGEVPGYTWRFTGSSSNCCSCEAHSKSFGCCSEREANALLGLFKCGLEWAFKCITSTIGRSSSKIEKTRPRVFTSSVPCGIRRPKSLPPSSCGIGRYPGAQ